MEVKNNKEEKPLEYYLEKYQDADPWEISLRCGLKWDGREFVFPLLGSEYRISHPDFCITGAPEPTNAERILFLRYLLDGKATASAGRFLAYQEFPWGEVYLQQFTGRCIRRFAFTYGGKPQALRDAMGHMPAREVAKGDLGYDVDLMPNLTIRFLLWLGDDEFPPSAQILFSDTFLFAFTAEDLANIGDIVLGRLKRANS